MCDSGSTNGLVVDGDVCSQLVAKEAGSVLPGSGYLGDNLGDVFQRLFDGVLGHVPLKSGDISNQVNCRGENKPSPAVYFHLLSPSICIDRTSDQSI